MPLERIKTYRSALRKLAIEAGLDPDNLLKTQLTELEGLERATTSIVKIKSRNFRRSAEEQGFNPDAISRHDFYTVLRASR